MADAARPADRSVDAVARPPDAAIPATTSISDGHAALERSPRASACRSQSGCGAPTSAPRRPSATSATIALVTALVLAVPLLLSAGGRGDARRSLVVALLALGPASDLAIALVNRAVTKASGPATAAPARARRRRAAELRTLVVVPTLLTSEADVEAQVGGLEVHYLGNREGDLRFALLSDWLDAPTEHVAGDDELLAAAAAAIDRLNERHGEAPGGGARFLLFHRERQLERGRGRAGWAGSASAASSTS